MRFVQLFRKRLPLRLLVILCSYKLLLYSSRSRQIHSITLFLAQWTFGKGDRSREPQKLMVNPKWINALGIKWSQLLYKFEHTPPLTKCGQQSITHMPLFKCYESSLSSWIHRLTSPFFCFIGSSSFRSSSRVCLLFFGETRLKLILLHHKDIHVWKKYSTYSIIYIYMEELLTEFKHCPQSGIRENPLHLSQCKKTYPKSILHVSTTVVDAILEMNMESCGFVRKGNGSSWYSGCQTLRPAESLHVWKMCQKEWMSLQGSWD